MDYWNTEKIKDWRFTGLISKETSAICFEIRVVDQVFIIPIKYEDWVRAIGRKARLRLVPKEYENYEVYIFKKTSGVHKVELDLVDLRSQVIVSEKEYKLAQNKIEKGLISSIFQFAKEKGWIDDTIYLTQGEIPAKYLGTNVERLIPIEIYMYLCKNKEVRVEKSPLYKLTCKFVGFLYKNPNKEV